MSLDLSEEDLKKAQDLYWKAQSRVNELKVQIPNTKDDNKRFDLIEEMHEIDEKKIELGSALGWDLGR